MDQGMLNYIKLKENKQISTMIVQQCKPKIELKVRGWKIRTNIVKEVQ
jgi:hypothetical protein